jgi:hypothetical protein
MTRETNPDHGPRVAGRSLVAIFCALLLVPGESALLAQATPAPAASPAAAAAAEADDPPLTADQLDSLVAPIALYPDALLAQVLAASTYPLELVQLQQWMAKNSKLKDKALADAVGKQPWDPSVQSMAAVPEALKRLVDDVQWTTDLGNAFLEQQNEVMEACQRMRKKAKDKGALTSNEQQKVETKVVEQKEVIVVQSANPEVVYVPSYNPAYVYPPPIYPYPPVYYPPYTAGAAFVSFGVGMMMGAAIWGGSCCGCGWGGGGNNNININNNNNFNRNTNVGGGNRGQGGGGNWNHNASHRGGTPYGNKSTANKYGGTSRGQQGDRGGASASNRAAGGAAGRGSAGVSDRSAGGAGGRGGSAGVSDRSSGGGSRGVGGSAASDRSGGGGSRGGGNSIGSRDMGGGGGSRGGSSGFGGGSGGYSGSSARSSSSRGSSSMGSRGGGGGGRGGGGRGGGRR